MRLLTLSLLLLGFVTSASRGFNTPPGTFVFVHGAWDGGWQWKKIDMLLTADGYKVYRPTLTGLGERVQLANADVNLTTHVTDIVHFILWENLHDIVLVGHAYGGVVITGVMDRVPDRIRPVTFIDAVVPNDGERMIDAFGSAPLANLIKDGFIPAS